VRADDEDRLLRSVALQNANTILTARRRAEEELVHAKEALEVKTDELARLLSMMRATLESTSNGILVTDDGGNVTHFNENYVRMWRVPRDVIESRVRRTLLEFLSGQFDEPAGFLARVDEIHRSSPPESFDVLELTDGRVFERFSRVQSVDGRNVGRVWSFTDITARRRAEKAARQAAEERKQLLESERSARTEAERASAMKDEFLATLSHELRTPLSAILGWAQVLRLRTMNETELNRGLETIERNARVQTQLIEDLLDMSRITAGKLRLDIQTVEPVPMIDAAIETVRPAAEAKGVHIEKLLDPSSGTISGDPSRLQQIIWNLLSNAIKFTPTQGKVQVVLERGDSHLELSVADTGIGIKPEFVPHVFERFRQADASTTRTFGGLGLGLAIVKRLVEMHGGTVGVKSPGEGKGTTFTVSLPLTAVQRAGGADTRIHPRSKAATLEFEYSDLSGIRVLVVDDELDARDLLTRILTECNAEVYAAGSAQEALALVESVRPNVLVTDIGMPDVDGYELLKRVRALGHARGGRLPAIALTAFARTQDRTRALRAGFLVHVSKPVEPSELVATVATVAGRTGDPIAD
jgi:signal transduction histidine kinase/ActR/RegA family two-component response regulator